MIIINVLVMDLDALLYRNNVIITRIKVVVLLIFQKNYVHGLKNHLNVKAENVIMLLLYW